MFTQETETVIIDQGIQKALFGAIVDRVGIHGYCANCGLKFLKCYCSFYDDGDNGIIQEGVRV